MPVGPAETQHGDFTATFVRPELHERFEVRPEGLKQSFAFAQLPPGDVLQRQVLELLRELQRRHGMSYIFISHDLAVIRAMAHRIVVMRQGRIVEEGETEALFSAPREAYTQQLLRASLLRRD